MTNPASGLDPALLTLMSQLLERQNAKIGDIGTRLQNQIQDMPRFGLPLAVGALGSHLTHAANHAATQSLEGLVHLALVNCRGSRPPTAAVLRRWLRAALRDEAVLLHDPPEDVFVGNVGTEDGNFRLFQGYWTTTDHHVESCLDALSHIDTTWAAVARSQVVALLRVSERLALRAGLARYTPPGLSADTQGIQDDIDRSVAQVRFSESDLRSLQVAPSDLDPFVFDPSSHRRDLARQSLGNTLLERRPLLRFGQQVIVALPTAIGPAAIRFVLERAVAEKGIRALAAHMAQSQFDALRSGALRVWSMQPLEEPRPLPNSGAISLVGRFDSGAYIQLLFTPDHLWERGDPDLTHVVGMGPATARGAVGAEARCAAKADYRRGLTICIGGGVGRRILSAFPPPPPDWYRFGLTVADFLLLSGDTDISALRAWKILDQQKSAETRGVSIKNASDFFNLYGWAQDQHFVMSPASVRPSDVNLITLSPDFGGPLRHRLRVALDRHAIANPDGTWVPVNSGVVSQFLSEGTTARIVVRRDVSEELNACIKTTDRSWWVSCPDRATAPHHRELQFNVWRTAVALLARSAQSLENRLGTSLSSAPTIYLRFPDIATFEPSLELDTGQVPTPQVLASTTAVELLMTPDVLGAFCGPTNAGDRRLLAALVESAYRLAGQPTPDGNEIEQFETDAIRNDSASFFGFREAVFATEHLAAAVHLGPCRLETLEDRAASHVGLAWDLETQLEPGRPPASETNNILQGLVRALWRRLGTRLKTLDRASVVGHALSNFTSIQKDRLDWNARAPALVATHRKADDVAGVSTTRETARAKAGVASRVVAEMAICTSPTTGGVTCGTADLDYLIAHVVTLIQYANASDMVHYLGAPIRLVVHGNGVVDIESTSDDASWRYLDAQGRSMFRESLAWQTELQRSGTDGNIPSAAFLTAFEMEFGIGLLQYADFLTDITEKALSQRRPYVHCRRSDVVEWLRGVGATRPHTVVERLALVPRKKWDEDAPRDASPSDWYPWRYNRRLSVTARPIVQLSNEADAMLLISPTSLEWTLFHLLRAHTGDLPGDLFDSPEMKSWIGTAIDERGHAFNAEVAEKLRRLRCNARSEVNMTSLGAGSELGDIDVLAWRKRTGDVFIIECKSLRMDRTPSEAAKRLAEYTTSMDADGRTPMQKHVDRITYIRANLDEVEKITRIAADRMRVSSLLVTDGISPMEFSHFASNNWGRIVHCEKLDDALGGN